MSVNAVASSGTGTVRVCGPGDLVGYGWWDNADVGASYSINSLDQGSYCFFDRDRFLRNQKISGEISSGVTEALCRIIGIKDARILMLENHSVKNRVAALLLSLNKKFGSPSKIGSKIGVNIDRTTLAELSGTVVETLSRVLTELEEEKLIIRQGRSIYLTSISGLERVSQRR